MSDIDPITAEEAEVARCVEEYRARRAKGEHPDPASFREELGSGFEDFLDVLAAETFLDEALTIPKEFRLPRAFGHYQLEIELGRGASGVVYEATDTRRGDVVALKIMRAAFDTDAHARERFLREATACRQVAHPCIVDIVGAGEIESRPYYAMTLIRGSSLATLTKRGAPLERTTLFQSMAGVADALAALHARGIVHRDVKPSNIMVEEDGRMVLADFGLARMELASTLTRTGSSLGTPLYMSPEQMMSKRSDVDGRSDIYGVGATLYEALCGVPPFQADDYRTLVPKILAERPIPPTQRSPDVPKPASSIVLKCLEKDPRDRYQNATDLADDLRAFADGRPVAGRPVSGFKRSARLAGRHPLLSSLAAALVIAAVLVLTVFRPPPAPAFLDIRFGRPSAAVISIDGVDVLVNGKRAPLAGLADYELEPGEHTIRCTAEGYHPFVETFSARSGETVRHSINMQMTDATLEKIRRENAAAREGAGDG